MGSQMIQANLTGEGNGLPRELYLQILLRCRGGTRGGPRGAAAEAPRSGGRGNYSYPNESW